VLKKKGNYQPVDTTSACKPVWKVQQRATHDWSIYHSSSQFNTFNQSLKWWATVGGWGLSQWWVT